MSPRARHRAPPAVVQTQKEYAILMAMLVMFCLAVALAAGAEVLTSANTITGHFQHMTDQGYQLSH